MVNYDFLRAKNMQRSKPAIGLYNNRSRNERTGGFLNAGPKKKKFFLTGA
jgi:hypothetical protein